MSSLPDFRAARGDTTRAVLEGFHALKHAIRFGAELECVVTRDKAELESLASRLAPDTLDAMARMAIPVSSAVFDQLAPVPPETGVIAIARRPAPTREHLDALPRSAPIILLEAPSHPGNIGAVIRVAAGGGAAAVLTTGANDPWSPAAIRGSAGLHYALPVARIEGADLPARRLLVIDPYGEPLEPSNIPGDAMLAFGSERSGLSSELMERADEVIGIPMQPGVSSLNLATSVAIVLYAWRLQKLSP